MFKKISDFFGGVEKAEKVLKSNWIQLNEQDQIKTIIEDSYKKPQVIFKHSTRCGISRMVFNTFESEYSWQDTALAAMYYLDILVYRAISNELASTFNIQHESPQLLLIKNGSVIYHTSHGGITAKTLLENLA